LKKNFYILASNSTERFFQLTYNTVALGVVIPCKLCFLFFLVFQPFCFFSLEQTIKETLEEIEPLVNTMKRAGQRVGKIFTEHKITVKHEHHHYHHHTVEHVSKPSDERWSSFKIRKEVMIGLGCGLFCLGISTQLQNNKIYEQEETISNQETHIAEQDKKIKVLEQKEQESQLEKTHLKNQVEKIIHEHQQCLKSSSESVGGINKNEK